MGENRKTGGPILKKMTTITSGTKLDIFIKITLEKEKGS